MAQPPHPPAKPTNHEAPKPPAKTARDVPEIDPEETHPEEQRRRAAEIEAMGVDAWKEAHDDRTEPEPPAKHARSE